MPRIHDVLALLALTAAVAGQGNTPETTRLRKPAGEPVTIRCLGPDGQPVAGAEVHLFQGEVGPGRDGDAQRYRSFGPYISDAEGAVRCPVALTYGGGHFDRWVYARVPDRLVGIARSAKWDLWGEVKARGPVAVSMRKSQRFEGTVRVPRGFDPRKVKIRVLSTSVQDRPSRTSIGDVFPRYGSFAGLDEVLPEVFETSPAEDGTFAVRDLGNSRFFLAAEAEGLGQTQYTNQPAIMGRDPLPTVLELRAEGVIEGRVVGVDGEPIADVRVTARTGSAKDVFMLFSHHARTDAEGAFRFDGLPRTEFTLSVEPGPHPRTCRPRQVVVVDGATTGDVVLPFERGTVVTGAVHDEISGRPVANVNVSAITDDDIGAGLASATTGDDGRFELRLPAGGAKLYFSGVPKGYRYPEPQIVKTLELTGEDIVDGLRFAVPRAEK